MSQMWMRVGPLDEVPLLVFCGRDAVRFGEAILFTVRESFALDLHAPCTYVVRPVSLVVVTTRERAVPTLVIRAWFAAVGGRCVMFSARDSGVLLAELLNGVSICPVYFILLHEPEHNAVKIPHVTEGEHCGVLH